MKTASQPWWRITNPAARQVLKTTLAMTLSLLIGQAAHLRGLVWAPIAASVASQPNVGSSMYASLQRILGLVIGALIGTAMAWAVGSQTWAVALSLLAALSLCSALKLTEAQRQASFVVVMCMLGLAGTPLQTGWNRFVDNLIGILVSVVVGLVLWPSRARHGLRRTLASLWGDCARLFSILLQRYLSQTVPDAQEADVETEIRSYIAQARQLLKDSRLEPETAGVEDLTLQAQLDTTLEVFHCLLTMHSVVRRSSHDTLFTGIRTELEALGQAIVEALTMLESGGEPSTTLTERVAGLESALQALHHRYVGRVHDLGETMRFCTLVESMLFLAAAEQRLIARIAPGER